MIIESKLLKVIEDEIMTVCRDEVKEGNSKELLGLEIQYFYDGEFADIGFKIVIFDNAEDEGYSIYKSLVLDYQEIKVSLLDIIDREEKANKYDTIRTIAKEIKEHMERIQWNQMVNVAEEFYIDLKNYD
ncbi:hypothetical protein [Clostridium sp.]|uniref:hypothetical protein n=1 Tax=Clostridium sp. TaxID=1506 RepID=UPI00262DC84E|nr:hypothetical protein [Clostridium sp.]